MGSSVSPKNEIWFLRVCHNISTDLYHLHGKREEEEGQEEEKEKGSE